MSEQAKNYISLSDMAKICPYDQEYLSLLARRGKIEARKIGKKWFTTSEAMNEYLREKRPGEKVAFGEKEVSGKEKLKPDYSWLLFGISFLFLILSFFTYRQMENKISELEEKAGEKIYSNDFEYPFNLPGYSDFFSPGKLEF